MKKTILISLVAIFSVAINARPPICLLQFYFEENSNWVIIMEANYYYTSIDSIRIGSSTGRSTLKNVKVGTAALIDIRNDSLSSALSINPDGDSVSITTYYDKNRITYPEDSIISESFVYGNYSNSTLPKLREGQSIQRFSIQCNKFYYSIAKSAGGVYGNMEGTLSGHIYDKNNNLLTKGTFVIAPYIIPKQEELWVCDYPYFLPGSDGSYSAQLNSFIYNLSYIQTWPEDVKIKIHPIDFLMEPDSVVNRDIHLVDDYVGIQRLYEKMGAVMNIFPNPVTDDLTLNYDLNIPGVSMDYSLELRNLDGRKITQFEINSKTGVIKLLPDINNGIYIMSLIMNKRTYASEKIIIIRQ